MKRDTPDLITTPETLRRLVDALAVAPVVAVDAEMDSFYSYREKICLIQFSTENGDYLVDPLANLDLSPLGALFADPDRVVVFHAGENDVPYFRRQYGFQFANLFDTYLAARVLGYPQCGLATLLETHFQVRLDKRFQMADWRMRPLPADMAEYARMDTRYLLELREILTRELVEADRLAEATSEFQRAAQVVGAERGFDPDGWVRIKGAQKLPAKANGILKALYAWRDREASRRDVPVFRVMPDGVLVAMALKPPTSVEEIRANVRHATARECAPGILAAVQEGAREGPVPAPRPRKPEFEPLTREQEEAFRRLRDWRNKRSAERGVEPDRVSPNRLLRRIVMDAPQGPEALAAIPGMEPWRMAEYGAEILALLDEKGQAS